MVSQIQMYHRHHLVGCWKIRSSDENACPASYFPTIHHSSLFQQDWRNGVRFVVRQIWLSQARKSWWMAAVLDAKNTTETKSSETGQEIKRPDELHERKTLKDQWGALSKYLKTSERSENQSRNPPGKSGHKQISITDLWAETEVFERPNLTPNTEPAEIQGNVIKKKTCKTSTCTIHVCPRFQHKIRDWCDIFFWSVTCLEEERPGIVWRKDVGADTIDHVETGDESKEIRKWRWKKRKRNVSTPRIFFTLMSATPGDALEM